MFVAEHEHLSHSTQGVIGSLTALLAEATTEAIETEAECSHETASTPATWSRCPLCRPRLCSSRERVPFHGMVGDILQPTHLLFVLVVALLVLGPKRLPEVGRALGDGIRDFRSAISGESDDRHKDAGSVLTYDEPKPEPKPEPETAEKHEFAHDSSEPSDKHEFAYEGAEPADKPAEPSA